MNNILNMIGTDEITTLEQLYEIQSKNPPSIVYLPNIHNTYDIDLNTRTIYGPSVLSVQRDHKSEIIYFKMDRYFDYMDLANTVCVIQYITPNDKNRIPYLYIVPYYDTKKYIKEGKIIFPWVIGGAATQSDGTLEYAIRFFKIDNENGNLKLVYNLNTLPTTSQVLKNIKTDNSIMNAEYDIPVEQYENLIYQLKNNKTYWTIL